MRTALRNTRSATVLSLLFCLPIAILIALFETGIRPTILSGIDGRVGTAITLAALLLPAAFLIEPRAMAARDLRTPAIVSSLLVLPFMILELANRWSYPGGFPIGLFGILWLLPFVSTLFLVLLLRRLPTGNRSSAYFLGLLPRLVILLPIAWPWAGLIPDQIPCFLGVPNCD